MMRYIDIAHKSTDYIVWWYDGVNIQCERCSGHMDISDSEYIIISGRVDLETNIGSIAFDMDTDITEDFLSELMDNFPGIKFYVFGRYDYGISLSEFCDKNKVGV